jgi:hypothetical protein
VIERKTALWEAISNTLNGSESQYLFDVIINNTVDITNPSNVELSALFIVWTYHKSIIMENDEFRSLEIAAWRHQYLTDPPITPTYDSLIKIDTNGLFFQQNDMPPVPQIFLNFDKRYMWPPFVKNPNQLKEFLYNLDHIQWECNGKYHHLWKTVREQSPENINCGLGQQAQCNLTANMLTKSMFGLLEYLNGDVIPNNFESLQYSSRFDFTEAKRVPNDSAIVIDDNSQEDINEKGRSTKKKIPKTKVINNKIKTALFWSASICNHDENSNLYLERINRKTNKKHFRHMANSLSGFTYLQDNKTSPDSRYINEVDSLELFYWDDDLFATMDNEAIEEYLENQVLWTPGQFIHINYNSKEFVFNKFEEFKKTTNDKKVTKKRKLNK